MLFRSGAVTTLKKHGAKDENILVQTVPGSFELTFGLSLIHILAVLYTDFHPRAGKRSGAWMTSYKDQWIENGVNSRPQVSVTMNFTKPSAEKPELLAFSDVNTFLHEFGHALHGMFANTTYSTMSCLLYTSEVLMIPNLFPEKWLA